MLGSKPLIHCASHEGFFQSYQYDSPLSAVCAEVGINENFVTVIKYGF